MTNPDLDDGVSAAQSERDIGRRKQAIVGVVGVVAILGGGALYITTTTGVSGTIRDAGALAPMVPAVSASASSPQPSAQPSATESATSKRVAARVSHAVSSGASENRATAKRIEAARSAAAKDGFPLQRPLVSPDQPAAPAGAVIVTNSGSLQRDGATLRVVTANYDLSGQHELAVAADDGDRVGNVRCTQNFRFSNDGTARERPTMLLCWRTSADKSVVTLAVVKRGRPSKSASAATIDKVWAGR